MNRQQKMRDDDHLMMMHVLDTGKTNLLGESKANHTTKPTQDHRNFHQSNNLPAENRKNNQG